MKNYFYAIEKSTKNILDKWFNGNMTIFFIHVIALIFIYSFFLGSIPSGAIHFIKSFSLGGMDSWNSMIIALTHYQQFPDVSIYQELLIENGIKFQYPPTSLLLFDIPERVTGISYFKIAEFYNLLSWFSVLLIAVFTAKILTLVLKKYNFKSLSIYHSIIIVSIITILFYPIIRSYNLGQIQTVLTLLATLVLYFFLSDKKKMAGFFLGLICLVKPQLGLILVWGIIRKEWSMVISGIITGIVILLPSIFLYGFHNHLDYLSALSYLSKYGESFYANQSINGLMNRLLFNGNNLDWLPNSFAPFHIVVYLSTLLSSIIFIFSGLFWHYKSSKPNVIELSIMILCATMASPIAWEHHYGILLPIFVLLSPFVVHFYQSEKWKILVFVLAFVVTSQFLGVVNLLANSFLNIAQSYLFFAALVILIFLFSTSKKITKSTMSQP